MVGLCSYMLLLMKEMILISYVEHCQNQKIITVSNLFYTKMTHMHAVVITCFTFCDAIEVQMDMFFKFLIFS